MINHTRTSPFRIAIAATFTADPLRPVLTFWGDQLHSEFDVRFSPYNQVLQTLLSPGSDLGTNTHGVNVALLRADELGDTAAQQRDNLLLVADRLRRAGPQISVPTLVALCPSHRFASGDIRLEALLAESLAQASGVHLIAQDAVMDLYPVDTVHSPQGERLGRIPYTEAYFCALGTSLVRRAHALFRAPVKLIALDCDNTLWKGICGEDGPENVALDEPRRRLQEFMLAQRDAGVLLTMASKNNEEDVLETFRVHSEMPLRPEHFVTWRLNWEPKSRSLISIAEQLSLGPDSFLFLDDNPKECAELEESLPQVLSLVLPEDIDRTPEFLSHVWAFDHATVTEEDRKRSSYYEGIAEFGNEARRAGSFDDFLATLQLQVNIAPMRPDQLARAAQLTQRTNQFNTTAVRRTESELLVLLQGGAHILVVEASDRFGDYGLVGVMILQQVDEAMEIESMLLSCRALGRGVEHRMLAGAAAIALDRGLHFIRLPYRPTAKNQPALQFIASTGFDRNVQLPAETLVDLVWKPGTEDVAPPALPASAPEAKPALHQVNYAAIARELTSVRKILAAMRESTAFSADSSMSEVERKLAAIWADLLEKREIRREDNFFDVGGHSLVAVLLLMRIRDTFGIELSIDDVYSGSLSLGDLATRIEAAQLGHIDPAAYAALIAEIEALTEEEAAVLLAQEAGQA